MKITRYEKQKHPEKDILYSRCPICHTSWYTQDMETRQKERETCPHLRFAWNAYGISYCGDWDTDAFEQKIKYLDEYEEDYVKLDELDAIAVRTIESELETDLIDEIIAYPDMFCDSVCFSPNVILYGIKRD